MEAIETSFSTDKGIGESLIYNQLENFKKKLDRFYF